MTDTPIYDAMVARLSHHRAFDLDAPTVRMLALPECCSTMSSGEYGQRPRESLFRYALVA